MASAWDLRRLPAALQVFVLHYPVHVVHAKTLHDMPHAHPLLDLRKYGFGARFLRIVARARVGPAPLRDPGMLTSPPNPRLLEVHWRIALRYERRRRPAAWHMEQPGASTQGRKNSLGAPPRAKNSSSGSSKSGSAGSARSAAKPAKSESSESGSAGVCCGSGSGCGCGSSDGAPCGPSGGSPGDDRPRGRPRGRPCGRPCGIPGGIPCGIPAKN
eukprot:scaffold30346_cov51-Phaeocystis_antarctica.AAC.2